MDIAFQTFCTSAKTVIPLEIFQFHVYAIMHTFVSFSQIKLCLLCLTLSVILGEILVCLLYIGLIKLL